MAALPKRIIKETERLMAEPYALAAISTYTQDREANAASQGSGNKCRAS